MITVMILERGQTIIRSHKNHTNMMKIIIMEILKTILVSSIREGTEGILEIDLRKIWICLNRKLLKNLNFIIQTKIKEELEKIIMEASELMDCKINDKLMVKKILLIIMYQ